MKSIKTSLSSYQKMMTAIISAIAFAILMPTNSVDAASKYLSVPAIDQEKTQWCWVTNGSTNHYQISFRISAVTMYIS